MQSATGLGALHLVPDLSLARRVRDAFEGRAANGVFGVVRTMPEEETVAGVASELDRVLIITQTVSIDYQRDATALWAHARRLYEDVETAWVFRPSEVARHSEAELREAMESKGRLRYGTKDAQWWRRNSISWQEHFAGDPRNLFQSASWTVDRIKREVLQGNHFRGLGGPKIFPLWLRMLADIEKYQFVGFNELPIPVDIHVARATFTTGVLRGSYRGALDGALLGCIRNAWREACIAEEDVAMLFDESLWQLSRLGCSSRHQGGHPDCPKRRECPIGENCPSGLIQVSTAGVEVST
jgi:hypothetical protein